MSVFKKCTALQRLVLPECCVVTKFVLGVALTNVSSPWMQSQMSIRSGCTDKCQFSLHAVTNVCSWGLDLTDKCHLFLNAVANVCLQGLDWQMSILYECCHKILFGGIGRQFSMNAVTNVCSQGLDWQMSVLLNAVENVHVFMRLHLQMSVLFDCDKKFHFCSTVAL
jgi:hypothetical protein